MMRKVLINILIELIQSICIHSLRHMNLPIYFNIYYTKSIYYIILYYMSSNLYDIYYLDKLRLIFIYFIDASEK